MPEAEKAVTSAHRHSEETGQSGQSATTRTDEKSRPASLERITLVIVAGVVVAVLFYVMIYVQTGAWQVLSAGGGLALTALSLIAAYGLIHRGKLDAAGYLILFALLVGYGAAELFLAGTTLYIASGGILLIFITGSIFLPRKWGTWLTALGLFVIYIFLVNQFELLLRYDIARSSALHVFMLGMPAAMAVAMFWQVAHAFHIGTIRTRLLIAFVSIVLLPAVVIITAPTVISLQRRRSQAVEQLELAAAFKEVEINDWVDALQASLDTALNRRNAILFARVTLGWQLEPTQNTYSNLRMRWREYIEQTGQFETLFLLDLEGKVVASTDETQEGQVYSSQPYFQEGLLDPYVLLYSTPSNQMGVIATQPVLDEEGRTLGIMAGYANAEPLTEIMRRQIRPDETERFYLASSDHVLFTGPPLNDVHTQGVDAVLETRTNGYGLYEDHRNRPVVGVHHWLTKLHGALLVEQDQAEAFRATYVALGTSAGIALLSVALAVLASLFITRSIANPMAELAETATQIAAGDLERVAEVKREDETGALARAFNSMTAQLRGLIGNLEQRVADRTRYLEASAEVGYVATSILQTEQLIRQMVKLIHERFSLYFVGLFLVDETGEQAVLRAGTGEPGQALIDRGYRIRVGEGIIGQSIANARPRISLDIDENSAQLAEAELPNTRSRASLPLRSRGRVLGALDVQSDQPAVFDQDTIAVWQTMADQIAVALDNARLIAETQDALEAARRAYTEQSREAWVALLRTQPEWGYNYEQESITPIEGTWRPEMLQAAHTGQSVHGRSGDGDGAKGAALAIPLKIRDQVVGVLNFYKGEGGQTWTGEEITLLETLAEQLSVALEGARLYQDTQRRAARERTIAQVSARMRETLDMETLLKAASNEMRQALGLDDLVIHLTATETDDD